MDGPNVKTIPPIIRDGGGGYWVQPHLHKHTTSGGTTVISRRQSLCGAGACGCFAPTTTVGVALHMLSSSKGWTGPADPQGLKYTLFICRKTLPYFCAVKTIPVLKIEIGLLSLSREVEGGP